MSDSTNGLLEATRYSFTSDGTPDVVWHVRRFSLVEGLSEPYRLTLELVTDDLSADPAKLLGAPCQLLIDRDVTVRTVYGLAVRITELGIAADRLAVALDVVPALYLLGQAVNTRFFQEKSVPDILREVLEPALEAEGRRVRFDLDPAAYQPREYCVQFRESDLDFAARLMQEEGILYYFEHTADDGPELLVLAGGSDRCRKLALVDERAAIDYHPRQSGTAMLESIDTFTPTFALRTTSIVQRDFDWLHPAESPYKHERRSKDQRNRDREVYDHDDQRLFRDDGAKRARRKLEQHGAQMAVYLGTSDVAELIPGTTFDLLGHHQPSVDRDYLLVRVRHRGEAPEEDLYTSGTAHARYENEFEAIPADIPWRPEPTVARPRTHGPQTAIVVGPPGEEIHTDEHGRIKVHFHWDRVSPFDDTASCWIRVVQRWAGPSWGALFIPRIGMEVIVEFLDGDPDRPVVTGCVYNGQNHPPYPLPDQKTKSTIKSETSPGGGGFNEIRFEDAAGAEEIFIHGQLDMNTDVKRDTTRKGGRDDSSNIGRHQNDEVGVNRTAKVGNNETLTVGVDQTISVGSNQSITVGANQTLSVGANQSETVGGNQSVTVSGNQTVGVSGNQSTTVNGNGTLAISGNNTTSVSGSATTTVNGSSTESISGTLTLTANGAATVTFAAAHSLDVGAARTTNIAAGDTLNVGAALSVTAAQITLTGGGSVIDIGPGGISITSGGVISITGATVNINS